MNTDDNFVLGIGLMVMLLVGIAFGFWLGNQTEERKKWCRLNHTELAAYESCLTKPDWSKEK